MISTLVVVATTKVRIFKQITTSLGAFFLWTKLLLLPQRYVFSSKSQHVSLIVCDTGSCCCYHKGTYFQANHNSKIRSSFSSFVVVATTKVRIFKQITTCQGDDPSLYMLLLLPQRYVFSSKSQQQTDSFEPITVVVATTKVRIFKQITTWD